MFRACFIVVFSIVVFLVGASPSAANMCDGINGDNIPRSGLYYSKKCQASTCYERAKRLNNKVSSRDFELFLVSGKSDDVDRLAIFQMTFRDVREQHLEDDEKVGKFVHIARDKIDFICNGEPDRSQLVRMGRSVAIPADEYDSYHRYFTVKDDDLGPVLHKEFHARIKQAGDSCIRTDDFDVRFLFLLAERQRGRNRFAELLRRIGLSTESSRALASPNSSEFSKVTMKVKNSGDTDFACFRMPVKMVGSRLKVEATDMQESIYTKILRPQGVFFEGDFVLSDD